MAEELIDPENPDLTVWVSKDTWEVRQHSFRPGDLIEIKRGLSDTSHSWGLYMGNGLVAHIDGPMVRHSTSGIARGTSQNLSNPTLMANNSENSADHSMTITCGTVSLHASPQDMAACPSHGGVHFAIVRLDPVLYLAGNDEFKVNNIVEYQSTLQRDLPFRFASRVD